VPELPEVETLRKYLEGTSLSHRITDLEVEEPKLVKPNADEFTSRVVGNSFKGTSRIGKFLFVHLSSGEVVIIHFGMTGSLKYFKDLDDKPKYSRVLFLFQNGFHLAFVCKRKLGFVEVAPGLKEYTAAKKLGTDALEISFEEFYQKLRGRKSPIKPRLLEQKILAGVGNWIADEILYQSHIHPETSLDKLDEAELRIAYDKMKEILTIAIEKDADWERFPDHFLTYQRHSKGVCYYTGKTLEKKTVGGRPTYISNDIQKIKK